MMSGGIAHTAFGGIGMGYFLRIEPLIGGLIFSMLASLGIATIHRKTSTNSDILIGMFWSFGMALGILFIAFTPGYPPDMTTYLFGDILTVSKNAIYMTAFLNLAILFTVIAFFNVFKAYLFDEEFASIIGIPVVFFEYLLFILISLTVVILIKVVGIILVIALLTTPATLARIFTNDLKKMLFIAILFGIAFCFSGLWASYRLNLPSGAMIVLVSIATYMLVVGIKKFFLRVIGG